MEEDNRMNALVPEVAKVDELDKNNLRVVLEPFERGFGYTIGHSLRRIMLSYMPGAAITEVKIDGVSHEYGTIEGIKEDILDVLLNLKDLAIKLDGPAEAELKLDVKTPTSETPIGSLSGGNQQKVLFGRSLRLEPSVLVLDEPTRGIDVGAKEEIHQLVDQASKDNAAILVASTDTDELVRLSHRVVVMVNGQISEELTGEQMTVENIEKAQLQSQEQKMKAGAHGNA